MPSLFVSALEASGAHSFASGLPLHYYRQLVAHVQTEVPSTRPYITGAWALVTRWEIAEPVQHRTPIPEAVVKAMAALAILWGWKRFAATLLLSFHGIARVGELLKAKRCDLLFLTPEDLLWEDADVLYLRIRVPKTRNRGAKVQCVTCTVPSIVKLPCMVWQDFEPSDFRYGSAPSSFRRRWDASLKQLKIEETHRLTPGLLRGGGAVAAHKRGVAIQDLTWQMRLQHQKTLSYYLQETTAVSILPSLSAESRSRVKLLRDAFEILVQ